jgi:hypothetical protein
MNHPELHVSASYGTKMHQLVQPADIELVLARFEEEVQASLIQKRIVLDTTDVTPEQTFAEFKAKYEPFLSNADLLRRLQTGGAGTGSPTIVAQREAQQAARQAKL